MDPNKDGMVTKDETKNLYTVLGEKAAEAIVAKLFSITDINSDGKFDFEEFCNAALNTPDSPTYSFKDQPLFIFEGYKGVFSTNSASALNRGISMKDLKISNIQLREKGALISTTGSNIDIDSAVVSGLSARYGAFMYVGATTTADTQAYQISIKNSAFADLEAMDGAVLYHADATGTSTLTLSKCTFSLNKARNNGLFNIQSPGATVVIDSSKMSGTIAQQSYSIGSVQALKLTISNSQMEKSQALEG
jgi:hypothetical protein